MSSEVVDNDDLQQLAQCAREGRHEEAEALLPFASPCAFTSADTPWTALHLAAYYGQLRVLRVFLRFICNARGQDDQANVARLSVDVRDRQGSTPLNCAAHAGRLTAARMLLSAGARLDVVDTYGDVPAVTAAFFGHPELVQLLLSRGQKTTTTTTTTTTTPEVARRALGDALRFAQCWKTAQAVLRVCPDAACDGGTAATTALLGICGASPPHKESPLRMVKLLWRMGADVDAADQNGKTPLHFAAQCGWVDVVSFLLHSCKTSAINRLDKYHNSSPLSLACEFAGQEQRSALVRILLRHGANPNASHKSCIDSPLSAAARHKHIDVARTLIDAGARMDVERSHRREIQPIFAAAFHKSRAHLKWFAKTSEGLGSLRDSNGYGLVHPAAESCDVGILKLVVRLGANPNCLWNNGRSALHSFVAGFSIIKEADVHGRLCEDVVGYLVKTCRLNPDQKLEPSGYSPLHVAAINDRCAEVARALIKHGATVDSRCAQGRTPLMYAAARGHLEVCKILLSAGANADCKDDTSEATGALLDAAEGQFPNVIALLLSHGASPTSISATGANGIWYALSGPGDAALTVRQLLKAGTPASMILSRKGTSLLHDAAKFNQIDSIPLIIKYGVDINARDKRGRTALHMASWYASYVMVNTLIENGADVQAKDLKGRCSLHIAAETMNVYFVKSLLDAGADINDGDELGLRPLMYACKCDESSVRRMKPPGFRDTISMVRKLLEEGASLNARSVSGFSALHIACAAGRCDVVNVLISAGAKMEARNRAGWTPLHLAAMSDRTGVLRLLAGHGALVDTKDRLGQSALHSAAARGHARTVRALLALGVSDDARDSRGRSALDAAVRAGHTEVAAVLLGHRDVIRRIGALDTELLLHNALVAAQRHARHETVQFLRSYGASDSGIDTGIKPALTKRAIPDNSDTVVGRDAVVKTGEAAMNEIIGGERNMVARLSGRRVRRSRSILQGR